MLLDGFKNTLIITFGALLIGIVLGTTVAVIKFLAEEKAALRSLAWLCNLYVTVVRGIPVVVLLLIFYFVILRSADGIVTGIVAFGINSRRLHGGDHPRRNCRRRLGTDGSGPKPWL